MAKGAVVLIKACDNTHPDPKKNAQSCWKKWDIINVHPIDWKFGRMEKYPNFYKIFVSNGSVEEIRKMLKPHETKPISIDTGYNVVEQPSEVLLRSKHHFRGDELSTKFKNELKKKGETRMSYNSFKKYMKNKVTGQTLDKEEI